MFLKYFAILFLQYWISIIHAKQNMLGAIKCFSWQRIFLKILWKDHGYVQILKNYGEENRKLCAKQRNQRVSLLRKTKKAHEKFLITNSKPFTIRKLQCKGNHKFEWKWWKCENWKMNSNTLQYSGNTVKNLNTSHYSNFDPIIVHVKDRTLKAVLKYKKYSGNPS